jgi:exodeoxyribonuclease V beta subunit
MSDLPDFDPLQVPLTGVQLVEASAGTGKTWSIVSLLLRAIALDGRSIDSAVVVTFTEAATRELRQRLRLRLEEALGGIDGSRSADAFVAAMCAEASRRGMAKGLLRQRVIDALVRCDEAWVHTIHGLCARWMAEFAFEQKLGLETWPAEEGAERQQQAVADVWRQQVVLAEPAKATLLLHCFDSADALCRRLRPLLALAPDQIDGDDAEPSWQALQERSNELQQQLPRLEASAEFDRLWAHVDESGRYHGGKLSTQHKQRARDAIAAACAGDPLLDPTPLLRLTSASLSAARNSNFARRPVPSLPALTWIDAWVALRREMAPLERLVWLHRLLRQVRERDATLRTRLRTLSFDDLVLRMRDQLSGERLADGQGEALAAQLAQRFPLAVVDEFQDTDAAQYAIFRAVYWRRADCGLFLVGDPKQAIYRFRGGDIFAYRRAMQDADVCHSLRHNRRSEQRTVDAVNALFQGRENPFVFDFIAFRPALLPGTSVARRDALYVLSSNDTATAIAARAAPADADARRSGARRDALETPPANDTDAAIVASAAPAELGQPACQTPSGEPTDAAALRADAGLTVWRLPDADGPVGHGQAERLVITAVAAEVARLIEADLAPEREEPPIAVLVGSHDQAKRVRRALARWGIACAYAGDGSVWASDAARALLVVIDALAAPRDPGLQRRALAGELLALDAAALTAEGADAEPRERALDALAEARLRSERRGPAAALLPLIAAAAAERLRQPDGRRWLSDALHLLELLTERWPEVEHLSGLAEWMQQCIAESIDRQHKPDDAERLRPESDRARVQLMTVHGSKGLQFDFVFAPFLWRGAAQKLSDELPSRPDTVSWHAQDGTLRRDPGDRDWPAHAREEARELFAESLRLAYVALTRARRRSWIVWGDTVNVKDGGRSSSASPLAYLLHGADGACSDGVLAADRPPGFGPQRIASALAAWNQRSEGALVIQPLPMDVPVHQVLLTRPGDTRPPRTFSGRLTSSQRMVSYSGLFGAALGAHADRPDHDALPAVAGLGASAPQAPREIGGSRFGECAHAALERIDFSAWPDAAGEQAIAAACRRFGYGESAQTYLRERIDALCRAPLIDGLRLGELPPADRLAELEFFFPLQAAALDGFYAALASEPRYLRDAPPSRERMTGFMRGFIDLVLRWQGRYYVFDYKTNFLGEQLEHYAPPALAAAVRESSYDAQYLVYTLAVHRHLRARLGAGYDYERDFGGVCYVYLRGLDASGEHGVFVDRPPAALIAALDAWASGAGA